MAALSLRRGVVGAALLLCVGACASPPGKGQGLWHEVRPGENVWRIARYYGADPRDVIRSNDIDNVRHVRVGTQLWIPRGRTQGGGGAVPLLTPPRDQPTVRLPRSALRSCSASKEAALRFAWPVQGTVTSRFGRRGYRHHDGLDISAPTGTAVTAAEAGRVIHEGRLGAYGRLVIVKHAGNWATVYAHNRKNRARMGDFVERGQVIAEVGSSGNASGAHLHFEIRRSNQALDPALCLP